MEFLQPRGSVSAAALRWRRDAYLCEQAGAGGLSRADWYQGHRKLLRQSAAAMLNADRDEIAFVKNTSEGISIVANGIDWQWGDRIVTTAVEYPANIYPWMELVRRRRVQAGDGAGGDGRRRPAPRAAGKNPRRRRRHRRPGWSRSPTSNTPAASATTWQRSASSAASKGMLFCVDAIQTLGVLPVDVQAMKIDYLSADGHKWLLGPEGAGVFYCRQELIDRTRPVMVGWMNVIDAQNYGNYNYTLRPDAGRFECGTLQRPGPAGLQGVARDAAGSLASGRSVAAHLRADRPADRGTARKGIPDHQPASGEWQWSGIVSFASPRTTTEQDLDLRSARSTGRRSPCAKAACGRRRISTTRTSNWNNCSKRCSHIDCSLGVRNSTASRAPAKVLQKRRVLARGHVLLDEMVKKLGPCGGGKSRCLATQPLGEDAGTQVVTPDSARLFRGGARSMKLPVRSVR